MLTYFYALQAAPASRAVPIAASYPLVAALLGIAFLGESLTLSKLAGTVLIIAGVWLVK
jgi:transporter family protein